MSDEGFHEIQLNGKQLVFLFMAATVVSVVIFLCGVMVGRGVRDRTAAQPVAEASTASAVPGDVPSARPAPADPPPASGSAQTQAPQAAAPPPDQAPPTPADEDSDYYDHLVKNKKESALAAPKPPPAASSPRTPQPSAGKSGGSAPPPPAPAPSAAAGQASSSGYAVQLVAVRERSEADAIAKRLVNKGYQAYVLVPEPGKPPVYRVQVGRFKNRGEADKVAARLRKEEQFKPWVTR
jgi:cell division protein FtsN